MNNLTYKLYHIPSEMYYCPSRTISNWVTPSPKKVKSNFSDKGKSYNQYPALSILGEDGGTLFTHVHEGNMGREISFVEHSRRSYSDYEDHEYQQPVIKINYLDWAVDMFEGNSKWPSRRAFLTLLEV